MLQRKLRWFELCVFAIVVITVQYMVTTCYGKNPIGETSIIPPKQNGQRYYIIVPSLSGPTLQCSVIDITGSDYRMEKNAQHSLAERYTFADVWMYMATRHGIYCAVATDEIDKMTDRSLYHKAIKKGLIQSDDYPDGELLAGYMSEMSEAVGKKLYLEPATRPCHLPGLMYGQSPFCLLIKVNKGQEIQTKQIMINTINEIDIENGPADGKDKYASMSYQDLWAEYCKRMSIYVKMEVIKIMMDSNLVIVKGDKDWYKIMHYSERRNLRIIERVSDSLFESKCYWRINSPSTSINIKPGSDPYMPQLNDRKPIECR